jgi:hypothetical protein
MSGRDSYNAHLASGRVEPVRVGATGALELQEKQQVMVYI